MVESQVKARFTLVVFVGSLILEIEHDIHIIGHLRHEERVHMEANQFLLVWPFNNPMLGPVASLLTKWLELLIGIWEGQLDAIVLKHKAPFMKIELLDISTGDEFEQFHRSEEDSFVTIAFAFDQFSEEENNRWPDCFEEFVKSVSLETHDQDSE